MQRFGEKLRILRKRRGLRIVELAVALGYAPTSNSYISEVETGKRNPKLEFVLKVADFFGVSVDLLTRNDQELPSDGKQASTD